PPSSLNEDNTVVVLVHSAKDLDLASASAKEVGLKCPLTCQAEEIFTELCNKGRGTDDFSCVFRHYYNGTDEL
ncbi:unnamed protein product, partial [Ilex paraguariensis]